MNELNLYNLFEQIIGKSKVMKRFVVAPAYGNELNKNNLGEILTDVIGGIKDGVKYPLCIMFPPVETNPDEDQAWSTFKCRMYFLTTERNDSRGIQNVNFNNNLSRHTIQQTWKDMRECAVDFRKVFKIVTLKTLSKGIRDSQSFDVLERVSEVANDRLAGIGISFDVDLFLGCEITDYTPDQIASIIAKINDLHPSHEH